MSYGPPMEAVTERDADLGWTGRPVAPGLAARRSEAFAKGRMHPYVGRGARAGMASGKRRARPRRTAQATGSAPIACAASRLRHARPPGKGGQ